jgi:hypothetical protein
MTPDRSSLLRRFITASRDFGFVAATRVAYSQVRGRLFPGMALPDPPIYTTGPRQLSLLLSTADHGAAALQSVVEIVGQRRESGWEACICARSPIEGEAAKALARAHGTQPWIRIVTTDKSIGDTTAARWTVEQATGEFVALLAAGFTPAAGSIARLVSLLRKDSGIDAAGLVQSNVELKGAAAEIRWTNCRLLVQRKSSYLASNSGRWPLTADGVARELEEAHASIGYLREVEK